MPALTLKDSHFLPGLFLDNLPHSWPCCVLSHEAEPSNRDPQQLSTSRYITTHAHKLTVGASINMSCSRNLLGLFAKRPPKTKIEAMTAETSSNSVSPGLYARMEFSLARARILKRSIPARRLFFLGFLA